jgi:hypothetical protein
VPRPPHTRTHSSKAGGTAGPACPLCLATSLSPSPSPRLQCLPHSLTCTPFSPSTYPTTCHLQPPCPTTGAGGSAQPPCPTRLGSPSLLPPLGLNPLLSLTRKPRHQRQHAPHPLTPPHTWAPPQHRLQHPVLSCAPPARAPCHLGLGLHPLYSQHALLHL